MKLDTATIANVARGAGFVGPDLHVATALALASSGGLTHYRHVYGLAGCGDLRGLWAMDIDRLAVDPAVDLYDPHTAAETAYALTEGHDGFGWSATYRAGAHLPYLDHAAGQSSRELHTQPLTAPYDVHTTIDGLARLTNRNIALQATIGRAEPRRH